jgi:hypothetical protein
MKCSGSATESAGLPSGSFFQNNSVLAQADFRPNQ